MKINIIIPAYNEGAFIGQTLESLVQQSFRPNKVVVVNDGSTDDTAKVVEQYAQKHPWIVLVNKDSKESRAVGSKVVRVFLYGYETIKDEKYDVICKMDADLIFPPNYFKRINAIFEKDEEAGMAGGICTVEKDGQWLPDGLTNTDHIRGALKAYRKACYEEIGGLQTAMGWDTVDQIKARFRNWKIVVDTSLQVKHLRPTNKASKWTLINLKNGKAMYSLRYGPFITLTSALKRAYVHKPFILSGIYTYIGYIKAALNGEPFIVSKEEGKFVRQYRWKGVKKKLGF